MLKATIMRVQDHEGRGPWKEGGASLRAAGFRLDKEDAGGSAAMWHNRPGRTAQPVGDDLIGGKWRWIG